MALFLVYWVRERNSASPRLPPTLDMSFTGTPARKTTVASAHGRVLHKLGYVRSGHLVAVTRDDLVGEHIGHGAEDQGGPEQAMGGALFIDGAYDLYRQENERDYGHVLDRDPAAGDGEQPRRSRRDPRRIRRQASTFSSLSTPGFRSRVAHHIDFPDYTDADLLADRRQDAARRSTTRSATRGRRAAPSTSWPGAGKRCRRRPLDPQRRSTGRAAGKRTGLFGQADRESPSSA